MPVGRGTPGWPASCIPERFEILQTPWLWSWAEPGWNPAFATCLPGDLEGQLAMFRDSEKTMECGGRSQAQPSTEAIGEGLHPEPLPEGLARAPGCRLGHRLELRNLPTHAGPGPNLRGPARVSLASLLQLEKLRPDLTGWELLSHPGQAWGHCPPGPQYCPA